jgi:hypothetical protein
MSRRIIAGPAGISRRIIAGPASISPLAKVAPRPLYG